MAASDSPLAVNLRRLLFFHHKSAREASRVLGVSERAVSSWLTGAREPGGRTLLRIAQLYDVDIRGLTGEPLDFVEEIGSRARVERAEWNISKERLRLEREEAEQVAADEAAFDRAMLETELRGLAALPERERPDYVDENGDVLWERLPEGHRFWQLHQSDAEV